MRRAWARPLVFLVAALPCVVAPSAFAGGARRADCPSKVPAEAQRVFDDTVSAFRSANARSIVALMERGPDARLLLSLQDVPRGTYASDQALRILENTYFKKRTVTSLTETKDCPKGEGASFTRSFLLTTKTETTEASEHLTVHIHRVDVQGASSIWVLDSLESKLIPQK